jgi:hypothetical protein
MLLETLVFIYSATRDCKPEDRDMNIHSREYTRNI